MLEAGKTILKRHPEVEFKLPVPDKSLIGIVKQYVMESGLDVEVIEKNDYSVFGKLDAAIASSGTVTLELALFGIPTVIIYKVSPLTYIIGKMLIKLDMIGLPNLIWGEKLFPELVQGDVTHGNIVEEVEALVSDESRVGIISERRRYLVEMLRGCGPTGEVAKMVAEVIEC
jgi:lipid-A-disaccharide synthase